MVSTSLKREVAAGFRVGVALVLGAFALASSPSFADSSRSSSASAEASEGTAIRDPGFIKAILGATASFWQERMASGSEFSYKIQRSAFSAGPFEVLVDVSGGQVVSVMEFPSARVLYEAGQTGASLWGMPLPQAVLLPDLAQSVITTIEAHPEGDYALRGAIVWPLKMTVSANPQPAVADDEVEYGITVYEPMAQAPRSR